MKAETNYKKPLLKYFILTYLIFLVLFGATGAAMGLEAPEWVIYILPVLCAWAPTFALLILYKRLLPDLRLKDFLKQQFFTKLNISNLLIVVGIQLLILFADSLIYSVQTETVLFLTIRSSSFSALAIVFLDLMIRGTLGEELGWRGYALNKLQEKHSPLVSATILGVVWGFWHAPLWFVTSGYSGLDLVKYIALFVVAIVAVSIIMAYFYNKNKNIIVPIVIHQLFNFLTGLVRQDTLQMLYYTVPMYVLAALIIIVVSFKKISAKPEQL